ncbi:MAG: ATP-binding protein [Thermodesulfovibrionia bacterium]|nr:ATP-binding protein [Thermodesulfovibrionia bacterium]
MLSKEEIFEALTTWNYWDKPLPKSVSRPVYEKEIARKAKTGEILILKGVRRSGKSTLLLNEMKRLTTEGCDIRNILYVNFEDPRFINHLNVELMERIKETYLEFIEPNSKPFFFFDEVQNIPAWEKWILKEYATQAANLYVTGSSSSLLSREIGTALSGRYLDIEVFPLSFQEFLLFTGVAITTRAERISKKTEINRAFRKFIKQGGFPKLVELPDDKSQQDLLKNYYDSILLRDIVARHDLTNYRALEEMAIFLLANTSSLNSTNKLKNFLGISFEKARDYTGFLEEAYLIFQLHRFSWFVKKQLANVRKFYSIDTGLSNRVSFLVGSRQGRNLENIIFIELIRRGQEIYYYKTKNEREVDFLIKEGKTVKELIQVSYSIADEKTRKREFSALKTASDELAEGVGLHCRVLTMDRSETVEWQGITIEVKNVIEWLINA